MSTEIKINGALQKIVLPCTLEELLRKQNINSSAQGIAVAVNEQVIPRSKWREIFVNPNDEIEIIRAAPGG